MGGVGVGGDPRLKQGVRADPSPSSMHFSMRSSLRQLQVPSGGSKHRPELVLSSRRYARKENAECRI